METESDNVWLVAEERPAYGAAQYPFQQETFELIGVCMEVHKMLGRAFLEVLYKDAIEHELRSRNIPFEREKKYEVSYKNFKLPHYYFADFVVHGNIILEIKAQQGLADENYAQVINDLAVSKCPIGLLVNFSEPSLKYRRVALTK